MADELDEVALLRKEADKSRRVALEFSQSNGPERLANLVVCNTFDVEHSRNVVETSQEVAIG